jgi:hypothetical protein
VGSGRGSKNDSGRSTCSITKVIALTSIVITTAAANRRVANVR